MHNCQMYKCTHINPIILPTNTIHSSTFHGGLPGASFEPAQEYKKGPSKLNCSGKSCRELQKW